MGLGISPSSAAVILHWLVQQKPDPCFMLPPATSLGPSAAVASVRRRGLLFFQSFAGHGDEADVEDLLDAGLAARLGDHGQALVGLRVAGGDDQAGALPPPRGGER